MNSKRVFCHSPAAIGTGDVIPSETSDELRVTVHNLGNVPLGACTLTLLQDGVVLLSGAIGPIAAPLDLVPRSQTYLVPYLPKEAETVIEVRLETPEDEITTGNNRAVLVLPPAGS